MIARCRDLLLFLFYLPLSDFLIGGDLRFGSYDLVWLDEGPTLDVAAMIFRTYVTDRVRVAGHKVRLLFYYIHGHLG